MTLDEVRTQIDAIDTRMKSLFLDRMECAKHVAEAKEEMGSDSVFVLEREIEIIEKWTEDVDPAICDEYVAFLRYLMSVSRRYQYGILHELQEKVLAAELERAGLDEASEHRQVKIACSCDKENSNLNQLIDMTELNKITIDQAELRTCDGKQQITLVLDGNLKDSNMRRFLCQAAKESDGFRILELR